MIQRSGQRPACAIRRRGATAACPIDFGNCAIRASGPCDRCDRGGAWAIGAAIARFPAGPLTRGIRPTARSKRKSAPNPASRPGSRNGEAPGATGAVNNVSLDCVLTGPGRAGAGGPGGDPPPPPPLRPDPVGLPAAAPPTGAAAGGGGACARVDAWTCAAAAVTVAGALGVAGADGTAGAAGTVGTGGTAGGWIGNAGGGGAGGMMPAAHADDGTTATTTAAAATGRRRKSAARTPVSCPEEARPKRRRGRIESVRYWSPLARARSARFTGHGKYQRFQPPGQWCAHASAVNAAEVSWRKSVCSMLSSVVYHVLWHEPM